LEKGDRGGFDEGEKSIPTFLYKRKEILKLNERKIKSLPTPL